MTYDRTVWAGRTVAERSEAIEETFIAHPQVAEAVEAIKKKLKLLAFRKRSSGVLLLANTGGGKSTLCKQLKALWPDVPGMVVVRKPVIEIAIPKPCTRANLAIALLRGLGETDLVGRADQNLDRAHELLRACQTKLLLVDNFHDIPERRTQGKIKDIGNWFRDLLDKSRVVMLALGIETAAEVMDCNSQLRRRAPGRLRIDYFKLASTEDKKGWITLLKNFDDRLPLAESSNLGRGDFASRLFFATNGILAYLSELLAVAMHVSVQRGSERLEMQDLWNAFETIHCGLGKVRNPFDEAFRMQPLIARGEPFYDPTYQVLRS